MFPIPASSIYISKPSTEIENKSKNDTGKNRHFKWWDSLFCFVLFSEHLLGSVLKHQQQNIPVQNNVALIINRILLTNSL